MDLLQCPACQSSSFRPAASRKRVAEELQLQSDFVFSRLPYKPSRAELKDLTDFMHGFPAPLVQCSVCGTLQRAEFSERCDAGSYEEDANDLDLMQHLLPRYVQAFRLKESGYRDLLPPHADVLEIGSHIGGFLQAAAEWNWRAQSLDVGRDTAEFATRHGFTVHRTVIEDSRLAGASFDAVFVWNCFEQLAEPVSMLNHAWRLLKRHGLLVLRVPNGEFYTASQGRTNALAWNNLLGFPYLHGYTPHSLARLTESQGFKYLRGFNSELITMPFPDLNARLTAEQRESSESVARSISLPALEGPWIELVFRRMSEHAWRARTARRGLAPELPLRRTSPEFLPRAA